MAVYFCFIAFNPFLVAETVNSWSFDEGAGTTAYDSAGSVADDGTLQNGAGWGSGVYSSSSLSLDGYDDYVSIPYSTEIDLGTGDFSFSFWMQKNTISRKFIYNQRISNGADWVAIEMTASGDLLFKVQKGGVFKAQLYSSGPLLANTLYHVAIVADRSNVDNCYIYINGVDMTRRTDDLMTADDISLPVGADIGRWSGGNETYNFDGMLDEFKMFDHALSEQEVADLYDPLPDTAAYPVYPAGVQVADVYPQVTLQWDIESTDFSYEVYFGDTELQRVATLPNHTKLLNVGLVDWAKTYYWKIDLVDSKNNVIPGPLWSFTTVIPVCSELLQGDVNGDCAVTLSDISQLASYWLQCTLQNGICP